MNQNANQMEYGLINVAHFIIDERNHGQKKWHRNVFNV